MAFYDFKPLDKKGREVDLSRYRNKVVIVINTASKCAFTSQFAELEALYRDLKAKYHDDVEFIAFPCDQFGHGDPEANENIQTFCAVNYGVSFPVLGKTDVNGEKAAPLYEWMKNEMPGLMGIRRVKWNFEKFVINRDGKVIRRYASTSKPESIKPVILKALQG
ncbi:hypothetical protein QM012_009144 [Aureobasidium pullulans]|uniref:Glutathione peroxidase n=1 Tax=Aureobasidium pullulans TaxID=5580 RepID=A0ABR0TIN1_AURPU